MKTSNNMLRMQQTSKNSNQGFPGNKQMQKNIQDRHMSVKSLGSQKLSEQSGKGVPIGQKLNIINNQIQQNYRLGAGISSSQLFQQSQNGGATSTNTVSQQQTQFQKMSQIYGSAEAILTGNSLDILTSDAQSTNQVLKSIDAENDLKNGAGSSINQQSISYRNDSQAYPYNSNSNQQFLKKNNNTKGKKQNNELLILGSKKSSNSVQKSPLNQRSIEDNLTDVLNQHLFSKKLKRDSSYPDKLQLQQAQSSKNQYLNVSIDRQQSTIQSQPDQTQILSQVLQNKRSPGKQSNASRTNGNFQPNQQQTRNNLKPHNTQGNPNQALGSQLRNQKQSTSQQQKTGHQVLVHPTSLSKMQQIKNIYSMQSTQNKYAPNGNAFGVDSQGQTSGVNNSMLEISNYNNQFDTSLQSSSVHFNGGVAVTSGTPKRNESQNSNYQAQVNFNVLNHNQTTTDLSLVSKTISIKGKNMGQSNKRNAAGHQQYTTNEYGAAISPKGEINDIQFTNQRKSQQSQKTVYNQVHGERDSIAIAKKNAVNPQINTINASKTGGISGSALVSSYQQPAQSGKIQKVQINKQLQKSNPGSKNLTNDNSMRNTQKSQWNGQGSQNSKVNSYYNTKSSFGIRNSNKNQAKQSIDYTKMEVRGKGGQINQTSVKQQKNASTNLLPKPTKLSSQFNKEQQMTSNSVVEISKHLNSNRIQSRNVNLNKAGQKTDSITQNLEKQRSMMASHQDGPTSRSLEPKETLDIGADNTTKVTNIQNFIQDSEGKGGKQSNAQQFDNSFLQDLDQSNKYLMSSHNQIPLIKNYNTNLKMSNQVSIINQQSSMESTYNNSKNQNGLSSLMHTQSNDKQKTSKTEMQHTLSKKQLHSFVDNKIEQSNLMKGEESSRKQDSKSLEAVDYFHQQGKAYKQHMKSQQLKNRLKNLQYSQAASESQHSMLDQKVNMANMRGPKPNLENKSSNQNSNIQSSVVSVKHQLPQIPNANQSKSETKVTNKFDTQVKVQKGKHDSALSIQKNRNQMTEDRNMKVQSKIDSPDQLSDQQTALKTPQNNTKLYKKNFQYSQNVAKNLMNIENINKQTPQVEQSSMKLLVPDSDVDIGQNSTSNINTKIDINSQEPTSALNDSYENINVPNMINLFSKRKTSNLNVSRLDDKYSPQIKDTASYSSMERPTVKQPGGNHEQSMGKDAKYKVSRKNQKLEALNNQSDGSFPNVNNDQLTDEQRFAPMNGVRDGFGVGPGTANTHGGYTRQKYKRNLDQSNVNYKLPSQQCYSEIVNFDNQQNAQQESQHGPQQTGENQQDFNIISTFEQSFEYAFDPTNFQNLDALDPKEEFDLHAGKNFEYEKQNTNQQLIDGQSSIPSIHSMPLVRNQKSQSTYRHNHQKISVSNKYHYYNQHAVMPPNVMENKELGQNSITQQQFDNMTNLNVSQISGQHEVVPQSGYMVHRHPQSIKDGHKINSNNKQEFSSFLNNINDAKINASQISQLSNDSDIGGLTTDMIIHNGGTRTTQNNIQNQMMYLSKRDTSAPQVNRENAQVQNMNSAALSQGDEGNPFSGPKLHLFKRGHSKSSQTKQRKVKTSQFLQRIHEKNSNYSNLQNYNNSIIQNYGQGNTQGGPISAPSAQSVIGPNGFSATQSQQNKSQINYRQLSEGGPTNSLKKKSHSNTRKPREGHINISEILNGNQKLPSSKFINADQMQTDTRSQNSQGLISQNSNEFGNGPPKGINIGENGRKANEMEQDQQKTFKNEMIKQERNNSSNEMPATGLMDAQFDGRIQNTPSQFSTIQQNVSANMFDDGESQEDQQPGKKAQQDQMDHDNNGSNFHFPMLAGAVSSKSNADNGNNFNQMSPYLGGINGTQRLGFVRKLQNESLQLPPQVANSSMHPMDQNDTYMQRIYDQQKQGMRPNTTNPTDIIIGVNNELSQKSPDPILQKPKIPVQKLLKPIQGTSHSNQTFKHPKIGNNSKHPDVFKNLSSFPGKKGPLQTKSQSQLRAVMHAGPGNQYLGPIQNSHQKLPNGFQLGLIQSHSQDYMQNHQYSQIIKDDVNGIMAQMPMTDTKKQENHDLLNDTQLTDTDMQRTHSRDDRTNLSYIYKDPDQNQMDDSPEVSASPQNENRNQHFETTFEGFNKSKKKKHIDQQDIQNTVVKEQRSNQSDFDLNDSRYVTPGTAPRPDPMGVIAGKFNSHEQHSRNIDLAQINSHNVPIQQQNVSREQTNMTQLNQLMDRDIDRNELSNNSARKGRTGGESGLQRSIDAKNIQLLRDKTYHDERQKFQSESKGQLINFKTDGIAVTNNNQSKKKNQQGANHFDAREQDNFSKIMESRGLNIVGQVNGLNSINSVVPSSPTPQENQGRPAGDSKSFSPNSSLKKAVSNQLRAKKDDQSNLNQNITKQPSQNEELTANRSSIAADEVSPSPLNEKLKNHLSSSPEHQISDDQPNNDNLVVSANAGGLNMNQTQTSHSIAQTPCFAETPNTTDQFKGYKIDPNDRINMSGVMLNTQQLNLPHNLMASSNGMTGLSVGSNRGGNQDTNDGKGTAVMTPQIGGASSRVYNSGLNSRGKSAKINNKPNGALLNQTYQHEIVESESLLESEADDGKKKNK